MLQVVNFQSLNALGRPFLPDTTEQGDATSNRDGVRVEFVRDMMRHAWSGYATHAWGMDELNPMAKTGKLGVLGGMNGFRGLGATMVDAMSTLHLMGMQDEFDRAKDWVKQEMDFTKHGEQRISFFETTIRLLGGLIAGYDLSGDAALLDMAEDLGDRLVGVFDGELSGIATNAARLPMTEPIQHMGERVLTAEAFSNLVEFGALGERTGREEFQLKSEAGVRLFHAKNAHGYLIGEIVERSTGQSIGTKTTAAPVDSYYEYLLKYWILGGKKDDHWRDRWVRGVEEALEKLRVTTTDGKYTFLGDLTGGVLERKLTHLGCYYPGNIALGVMSGAVEGEKAAKYLDFAMDHLEACMLLYSSTKTGLGAESAVLSIDGGDFLLESKRYFQRPEVVESIFYLWRATHDERWREYGWAIAQAIEKWCRVDGGYIGVMDVDEDPITPDDTQQSWFLAETLKYLYLLFEDDGIIDVTSEWVLNTEAHPVRSATSVEKTQSDWIDWSYLQRSCQWPMSVLLPVLRQAVSFFEFTR